jgi:hypothetical protein
MEEEREKEIILSLNNKVDKYITKDQIGNMKRN